MKIAALPNNIIDAGDSASQSHAMAWRMYGDSNLSPCRKPFFVPDFADTFNALPGIALRISRLGKSVPPRFASRYWMDFCCIINFCSIPLLESLSNSHLPADKAYAFDKSICHGEFLPSSRLSDNSCISLLINGSLKLSLSLRQMAFTIDDVISAFSSDNTIKTGDLIIPLLATDGPPVVPGQEVALLLDSEPVLSVRIR